MKMKKNGNVYHYSLSFTHFILQYLLLCLIPVTIGSLTNTGFVRGPLYFIEFECIEKAFPLQLQNQAIYKYFPEEIFVLY